MCEFCVKHGEGKKWYLNAKNYSDDLLSDVNRRKLIVRSGYWISDLWNIKIKIARLLPVKIPVLGRLIKGIIQRDMKRRHWGQIIPIEDVEKILNFTNCITRIPCICRHLTTGKECRLCFLISLNPDTIGMADVVDQSYFGGPDVARFEKVDKKWALNFIKETENKGMAHSIWTFDTPFIGALCNCEYATGCISMKMYKEIVPIMFRGEYAAVVDTDKCVGCGLCVKICQFEAIEIEKNNRKAEIDAKRCYGCGLCRTVCSASSITLRSRGSISEIMNLW